MTQPAHPLLDHLPPGVIAGLLKEGALRALPFKKGAMLHAEGDLCAGLELITQGRVAVHRIALSGDYFTVSEFTAGQTLGGNLVFSRLPRYPMTLIARTDGMLLILAREPLFALCTEHPGFLKAFLEHISDHAGILGERIRTQERLPLRGRIIRLLVEEAQKQGGRDLILPASKTDLAAVLGVRRTSLSRELAAMRSEGLIVYDARRLTLLRLPEELAAATPSLSEWKRP